MAHAIDLNRDFRPFIEAVACGSLGGKEPVVSVSYPQPGMARIQFVFTFVRDIRQDDWQVGIRPAFDPVFHWAPHLSPTDKHVIDQHSFRSPALIVHDGSRMLTIIPDPDLLLAMPACSASGEDHAPRWYMDLDAPHNELTLGMTATAVKEHVLYERKPGAVFPRGQLAFGLYIMVTEDADEIANPWRRVLDFLWKGWGHALFAAGEPLRGPLEPYVKHAYAWAFDNWADAVWQQFEEDGRQVGGPAFIVNVTQSPNYPGPVNERELLSIWNQVWFSSLRSASGLYRYGKRTGNDDYVRRALLTKELALAAPQNGGFFPAVIATEMEEVEVEGKRVRRSKGWETRFWGNSNRNPFTRNVREAPFHVLDMSWTCLLMLRWYEELERDERLLAYAVRYADALLGFQDKSGFVPGWIDLNTHRPLGVLDDSPETSMSVTFLLKLHALTGDLRYLKAASRAIDAVSTHIVPTGRWEDFESYYSCSHYGHDTLVGRKVERNNLYKQCNFSMFWTAEALFEFSQATGDAASLQLGRRCLDELLMTQASWQPPYIFVPTLGSFGVLNADGEWNDARQSLFAELIIRYGKKLGVNEYVERGLAALHASFALMYCPENPAVKDRWEKAWPFLNERDYGFMMENYGHGGRAHAINDYMGEFTIFDWGNGAAAESFLRISDHFGQQRAGEDGLNLR